MIYYLMELLVAYQDDPAGNNIAKYLSQKMKKDGEIFRGAYYDLLIISTPAISADWLEEKYDYDGFIFLSKHAAESGFLALTCHSTGNFSEAKFGGNDTSKWLYLTLIFKRNISKHSGNTNPNFLIFKSL